MKNYLTPQVHPIELPPKCTAYFDPDLDQGCSTLTDWASIYGMSRPRYNLAKNPAMNTGTTVVTNFTSTAEAGITAIFSIDSVQRIDITASTTSGKAMVFQDIPCSPGEIISASVWAKKADNANARIVFLWYNGTTYLDYASSNIALTDWSICTLEGKVVPANATKLRLACAVTPTAVGNTGTGWFKNILVVKGSTINRISDPHQKLSIIDNEIAGEYGVVRSFNGLTDCFYCDNHSNIDIINPPLLLGSVFYGNPSALTNGYLISKNNNDYISMQYGMYWQPSTNNLVYYLNGTGWALPENTVLKGKWNFIIMYWDGAKVKVYVNNKLISITTFSGILTSQPNFRIGCRANNGIFLDGKVGVQFISQCSDQDAIGWSQK
jgi:hypothetical protein